MFDNRSFLPLTRVTVMKVREKETMTNFILKWPDDFNNTFDKHPEILNFSKFSNLFQEVEARQINGNPN